MFVFCIITMFNFKFKKMKNCFVLMLLLSLLIPSAGESYAGELFKKKKKKKETTEEVKLPVAKKKK